MKVVYSNTNHWQLARWITAAMSVTSCVIMVWILVQLFGVGGRDTGADDLLQVCLIVLIVGVIFMEQKYLDVLTVDEEAGLVYARKLKNCPIKISELATVTYKKNMIGRFSALVLHDNGIAFFDFRTSEANADHVVSHLQKLNPSIEVKR